MLQIENISVSLKNKCILHQFSAKLEAAQLLAIVGPNGAGKSTLLRAICGDYGKQNVSWHGCNLHDLDPQEAAKQRAVLTQKNILSFDFTVEEVVMMGRYPHFNKQPSAYDYEVVERMMARMKVSSFAKRSYHSLSGGEQQRVQTARVFAQLEEEDNRMPKLLLLDEPLNNLDVKYQYQLLEQLVHYAKQGHLVVIVMHDLNLAAQYADQMLLLQHGLLKKSGTVKEVLQEDLLEEAYQLPVRIDKHPYHDCPMIFFGQEIKQNINPLPKLKLQTA